MSDPIFGDVIHAYTRAEALADGTLIDVSGPAHEAGIRFPTAITAAAWSDCVAWTRTDVYQDESGRLWDVVFMMAWAMRTLKQAGAGNTDRMTFILHRIPNHGRCTRPFQTKLKAVISPGDDGYPVITIMLPEES